jgi:hypothetical protein
MQDKPSGAGHERAATTAEQDDRDQRAVLMQVLLVHPEPITREELVREMTFASADPVEEERIERALRDLRASGLLYRRDDDLVMPTRPAVRFYVLAEL